MLKPLRRALWLLLTMVDPNWWERELKGEPIPEPGMLGRVTLPLRRELANGLVGLSLALPRGPPRRHQAG
jgi:hypothetical protein